MSSLPIRRRILGVDFGRARIGIAVSDELGLLAHPVETIPARENPARRIDEIVREKNVERVVIGLPRHMNGSMGEAAGDVLAFAEKLRKLLPCEILVWDERLTTIAANRALREGGQKTRNSRSFVDQVAAQMILQGYLDGLQSARDRDPEPGVQSD
ncbi:MAG TPA: Holliday junction resolvase RuvX [Chthoniobacterales bacterium]|nr:Holliday junction resolvase RuvX [Chthoniobacterales bacterium]